MNTTKRIRSDKFEKSESLMSNSKFGTVLLAVINIVNEKHYATFSDVYSKVFLYEKEKGKKNTSKIHNYLDILSNDIKLDYYDLDGNETKNKPVTGVIIKDQRGVYNYDEEKLVDFFLESMKFACIDYLDEKYNKIFENIEVRKFIHAYLVNFARIFEWEKNSWCPIEELISFFEKDLVLLHYEYVGNSKVQTKISLNENILKLAEGIVRDLKKDNPILGLKTDDKNN